MTPGQVERARALQSGTGSVMNAILMAAEEEKAMAEDCEDEDEFLTNLLGTCLRKKGSRLELQLGMARERERDAEGEEEAARKAMTAARDEVYTGPFYLNQWTNTCVLCSKPNSMAHCF